MDPKLNEEVVEEEKDNEEELSEEELINNAISKYRNNDKKEDKDDRNDLKDRLMKIMLIIAVVTVIVIFLLLLISKLTGGKKSYDDIENVMVDAAERYYAANKNLLPKTNGGTVEVSAQKLINLKYMKSFDKYKKGANCTGKVVVENNDDNYNYTPYLSCNNSYSTSELYRKVTDKSNIVTTGYGLYQYGSEYVYRGEDVNNYVLLNNNLWRIVKVTANNETVLVKEDKSSYLSISWDDRYNSVKGYNIGINDFDKSRIKDSLNEMYNTTEEDEILFTEKIKQHMVSHAYCSGKRSKVQNGADNSVECSKTTEPLKVGLLTVSDYMRASLDNECNSTTSYACQNYNYLVNHNLSWWLITGDSENSYDVYGVSNYGRIESTGAYSFKNIRPVIYLDSKTMYSSGEGTEENPYVLK